MDYELRREEDFIGHLRMNLPLTSVPRYLSPFPTSDNTYCLYLQGNGSHGGDVGSEVRLPGFRFILTFTSCRTLQNLYIAFRALLSFAE